MPDLFCRPTYFGKEHSMKKSKAVSLILGIAMFLSVMSMEGSSFKHFSVGQAGVAPTDNQPDHTRVGLRNPSTAITNKEGNHNGIYISVTGSTPSLNGTMVISGSDISYSCGYGNCQVSDIQITSSTVSFRATCGATAYTFSGTYVVNPSGPNYYTGTVSWQSSAAKSTSAGDRSSRRDEDEWTATAKAA